MPNGVGLAGVVFKLYQVHIVVLEHGERPAKLLVVAQHRKGTERLVVTVNFKAGRF